MNILAKGNIINKEQAEKISKLMSKRNIFAHVKVANVECNFEHPKVLKQNQEGLFGF